MSEGDYNYDDEAIQARESGIPIPIHPLLLSRTSPREMTGEDISSEDLMRLFEAARWAPSHYNLQPWRFVYAKRNTSEWQKFIDLLWPLNREWAQHSGALIVVLSNKYFQYKGVKTLIPTYSYDTGAAWLQLALEGTALGFVVHGMGGFDYDKAYEVVGASKESHNIEAMIAVGKRPQKEFRKLEERISQRNAINSFVFEATFVDNDSV